MYKSTLSRIEEVRRITRNHYEPGNQSKCLRAVWRNHIEPQYGICYHTYLHYVKPIKEEMRIID